MVTLVAVLQSQSVELAGTRCDPASKARHSGHSGVTMQLVQSSSCPESWCLQEVEGQASVNLFVV